MDLDGLELTPREGRVLVRFVDDDEDVSGASSSSSPEPMDHEGVIALVVAVGPKVKNCKAGDIVITTAWARNGTRIGRNTLVSDYEIEATVDK